MSAKTELIKAMKDCGEGTFTPPIDGVVYGFAINGEQCEIFDTVEDDDYRTETFDSVESAVDGFMIANRPLSSRAEKISVDPIRNL